MSSLQPLLVIVVSAFTVVEFFINRKIGEAEYIYKDEIDRCKIVDLKDLKDNLIPKSFIEHEKIKYDSPEEIKKQYIEAYEKLIKNERIMREIIERGEADDE